MRTNPEKCRTCMHNSTDPKEEPCFICVGGDEYEKHEYEGTLDEILEEMRKEEYKPLRRRCYGGQVCYAAPF